MEKMGWFNNIKIHTKLSIAFGILVFLMIVSNAFALKKLIRMDREYTDLIRTSIQQQIYLVSAIENITKLRFHNLSSLYSLTGGVQEGAISEMHKDYDGLAEAFINNITAYRNNMIADSSLTVEETQVRLIAWERVKNVFLNVYVPYSNAIDDAVKKNDRQKLHWVLENGLPTGAAIEENLEKLRNESLDTFQEKSLEVRRHSVSAINMVCVTVVCIVFFSLLLSANIAKSIEFPISKMQKAMAEISRGNLAYPIRSEHRDEMGMLSGSIGDMVDKIAEMNKTTAVMDYMDCMIYIADLDYNIIYINKKTAEAYGADKENCINQKCYAALRGFGEPCPYCLSRQIMSENQQTSFRSYDYFLDKKLDKWLGGKAAIIQWVDGSLVQFNYLTDETMKRDYEEKLREAAEAARAASISKSAFLANMSHEIRTPMNASLGITEIQMGNETLPPDVKNALGRIYSSGDLLMGIINDILDLSKIEAGKLELTPVRYDVASLINDAVLLNKRRYEGKPIEFGLRVEENVPSELIGDELRIKQILNNLLSNAFKYTKSGEVVLSVSAEPVSGAVAEAPNVTLIVSVKDTGQGMTEDQVGKLFDNKYVRFNMAANRTTEGTGLGMSITSNLVQLMNGEILVKSEPGKGSAFTVRLQQGNAGASALGKELAENLQGFRLSHAPQAKKAQITREPMPYGSVLVVDDTESNLFVARGLMSPYGLKIDTAMSGFETIDKIRAGGRYDIVFMDHMMPYMDGIEAVKIIRGMGYTHPIVALTANAVAGQADVFLANGFDGFISKPIDIRQLNATLNKLIRDKQPPEAIKAARRQSLNQDTLVPAERIDPRLVKPFVRDANKALGALEAMFRNAAINGDENLDMYVILAHGMKSALANVGENDLSKSALRLEQAGRDKDMATITAETPAFLAALREVVKKLDPGEENQGGEAAGEDADSRSYLREKLLAVKAACEAYDIDTVESALAELRQKTWSRQTREALDSVAGHLLHSDFEEAAGLAADYSAQLT
jgi:signal transduction histidine kinase/DNA-binding NarL/FixJ family response regulator/HAMP domain-containing protein/HPt (histidine-containing phosphotransfer) domain-containing protein